MDEERHPGATRGQTAAYQSGPSLGEEFETEKANSVPSKCSERPSSGLRPYILGRPFNSGVAVCLLRSKR